jgi:hypothetical protein
MTKRLSDKWVLITLISFISIFVVGIGSDFIPNPRQYGNEILIILLILVGMFISGQIQIRRLDKIQCKRGEHNPNGLKICIDCHKRLEGSEDLIAQHNRELDRKLSTNRGFLKITLPSIGILIFMIILSYWIVTSSHADLINGINSINATDPTSCRMVVEQKAMEQGMNAWMMGSHVVKATNDKWNELDCIHKPIMDDLNETCPIGVIPTLQGLKGFLCYPEEEVIKK